MAIKKIKNISLKVHMFSRQRWYETFGLVVGIYEITLYFGYGYLEIQWKEY